MTVFPHMYIESFAQEVPQLPARYSDWSRAWHGKQLLSSSAIIVWECQVLISVEWITIDFVEPGLEIWWNAFVYIGLAPVKGHAPFSRPCFVAGVFLALEYFAWDSELSNAALADRFIGDRGKGNPSGQGVLVSDPERATSQCCPLL
jgi:hypothetical protein